MSGKKLLRRGCGCALMALLVLGLFLAAAWWRSRSEPKSFKRQEALLESRSAEERRQLAERVEQRLRRASRESSGRTAGPRRPPTSPSAPVPPAESLAGSSSPGGVRRDPSGGPPAVPPGGPLPGPQERSGDEAQKVTLHLDELNALLQERVARWEAQRKSSPLPVRNPILAIEGDHLVLFVQLLNRGSEMLLGLPLDIAIDDHGGVARLLGVRLGQLPLPGLEALPRLLRSTGDAGLAQLAEEAETAATGYPFDPLLPVDGGPPLRIVGLQVDGDGQAVHLTLAPGS